MKERKKNKNIYIYGKKKRDGGIMVHCQSDQKCGLNGSLWYKVSAKDVLGVDVEHPLLILMLCAELKDKNNHYGPRVKERS